MSRLADRIDTTGLQALDGFSFPALTSPESLTRAAAVAERCQRALDCLPRSSASDRRSHSSSPANATGSASR
jgi:hypothetical protein